VRAIIFTLSKSARFRLKISCEGLRLGREMFVLIWTNGFAEPDNEDKQISRRKFHAFFIREKIVWTTISTRFTRWTGL